MNIACFRNPSGLTDKLPQYREGPLLTPIVVTRAFVAPLDSTLGEQRQCSSVPKVALYSPPIIGNYRHSEVQRISVRWRYIRKAAEGKPRVGYENRFGDVIQLNCLKSY
ncbi:hypothetical protein NPIL_115961 [Nephila pilipes]|uniref:Uncharacterized protein n=1 Tax=Nephila pilipes TaxID=299642 RepID=A0A8X6R0S0_NEPPI|nr:hypothetical protein NPIL_115961 [Nephila pilipes]